MSVFKDLKAYKKGLILVFFLTMGNAIGELLLPFLLSQIVDEGIAIGAIDVVLRIGVLMVLVTLATAFVRSSASYFSAKNAMGFSHDLRNRIFNKVNTLTFDETEQFGISSLITRTTNDVDNVEQFVLVAQRPLLRAPLQFFGGLVMAFLAHERLTFIVLSILPFIALLFISLFEKSFLYFESCKSHLIKSTY